MHKNEQDTLQVCTVTLYASMHPVNSGKTSPGALCPALGSPSQETFEPEGSSKDDQEPRKSDFWEWKDEICLVLGKENWGEMWEQSLNT